MSLPRSNSVRFALPTLALLGFVLSLLCIEGLLAQDIRKRSFRFRTPNINADVLESPANLNAAITLTKVRRGFFTDGKQGDGRPIAWEPADLTCAMRYSRKPGQRIVAKYPNVTEASGTGSFKLNPTAEGMRTGVYYCILVAEDDTTQTSVEFKVVVQANVVPNAIEPVGRISIETGPPLFRWDPVEGVPYYFLFLSEGPLSIERDETGRVTGLKGLNLTWQILTPSTFANFGEPDPSGAFSNVFVPPLLEGIEYNWLVLNAYSASPELISTEIAPVAPSFFEVDRPTLSQAPQLLTPAAGAVVADKEITFSWSPLQEASRYRIYLYEGRRFQNSDIDYVIWSQVTTDTEVTFRAQESLVKGTYHWRVVAEKGPQVASDEWREFVYDGPAGWVKFLVGSPEGPMSRVEIEIRNEANGQTLLPFLTDSLGTDKQPLPAGTYTYTASRSGFLTTPRDDFQVPNDDTAFVDIHIERSPNSLDGRIVDENGAALFDATVELRSGGRLERRRSDDEGYFSFSIPPETWQLRAYKKGFVDTQPQTYEVAQDQARNIGKIRLRAATNTVSGQVLFADDSQPLQGALILAQKDDIAFETSTNNQGGFQFRLGPGSWKISLDPQGFFASPAEVTLELSENQQQQIQFLLFPGSLIIGKVEFEGRGLADATVAAVRQETGELVQSATSNVRGDYALGLRDPGEYELVASRENFLETRRTVTIAEGETRTENFTLAEAGYVKGTVFNVETFEPVEGARVFVVQDTTRFSISDADGRYVLSVPPNQSLEIDAVFPGFGSTGPYSVTVAPGDSVNQDVFLRALSGIVQGRVTDGFLPISDAQVEIVELDLETFTDADGRFRFEIAPGTYTFNVSKDCHFSRQMVVDLAAGEVKDLQVVLEPLESIITGHVRDVRGDPIDGATIEARGDTTLTAATDVSGYYELCLSGGIYNVVASRLGYEPAQTTLVVSSGDSLGGVDFVLADNFSRLSGTVRDTLGQVVPGAVITLSSDNQTLRDTTDASGSYSIERIFPGLATIRPARTGFFGLPVSRFFSGKEEITLDLTLFPADGFIRGTAFDAADNAGIPDVTIKAEFSETPGQFFTTTTDVIGRYQLRDLPVVPGTSFRVFAFKDGYVSQNAVTGVLAKSEGVDFFLVSKNAVIEGLVHDMDTGEAILDARVDAVNASGGRSSAVTDSAGQFMLKSLVPNTDYTVTVSKRGYFQARREQVAAGDTNVVIPLLRKYAFISGKVLSPSGTGMANVKVVAEPKPGASEGRAAVVHTEVSGSYRLKLIADTYTVRPEKFNHRSDPGFRELTLSEDTTVTGVDFVLEKQNVASLTIQRADNSVKPSISNREVHCYTVSARDVENRPVYLAAPEWALDVSERAAFMDSAGCLHLDPNFFGDLTITARDPLSGIEGSLSVQVFAPIDSTTEATLFNDRGLELVVTRNAVLSRRDMLVAQEVLAPAKKGRAEFLNTDYAYILKPAGLVFNSTVKLNLPPPENSEGQDRFVARWDGEASAWQPFASTLTEDGLVSATILETGEYTSLAVARALTLENISLMPNPFSPHQEVDGVPGLRITFDLSSSAAPNPLFTVKIYNLEGNLVRLLHDQTPFSRGNSVLYWDGRADNGALARNGRYIIHFIVEDPSKRVEKMKSVVLIK